MHRVLIGSLVALASATTLAQDLPPAADFYYCSHFYRWVNGQLKDQSSLKSHVMASQNLFDAGAVILSGGTGNKAEYEASADKLRATLKQARDENQKMGDLFKSVDDDCWAKQRRYAMAIMKKSSEVGAAQNLYFTHDLAAGQVDAADIAKRQEFIKSQPGLSVDDQKDVVIYSFARKVGETSETAHHVFTKEGNPAHPAVIFLSSRRVAKDRPPVQANAGSYAGSKSAFDGLYMASVLMNQGR